MAGGSIVLSDIFAIKVNTESKRGNLLKEKICDIGYLSFDSTIVLPVLVDTYLGMQETGGKWDAQLIASFVILA